VLDLARGEHVEADLRLGRRVVDQHVDGSQLGGGCLGDLVGGLPATQVDRGNRHGGVAGPQLRGEADELGL
jgi:hypothetical protein